MRKSPYIFSVNHVFVFCVCACLRVPFPYSLSTCQYQISYTIMAALLSSWSGWWSGKGSEGEKEEGEKEEGEKEEEASKTESWSAGIGSKKLLGRNTPGCRRASKGLFPSLWRATSISPCSCALVQVLSAVWGTTPLR